MACLGPVPSRRIRSAQLRTKAFSLYEGISEQAVRDAATDNKIPVDAIYEIPVVLKPK